MPRRFLKKKDPSFIVSKEVEPSPLQLRVGLTGRYPPFNYFDESGALKGFDVEVANYLCEKISRPCDFKILQWDGILAALLAQRVDAVIGSMAITPSRRQNAAFTIPYYESGAQLFVRKDRAHLDPNTPGFRIGVTLGTTYGAFVRKHFPKAIVQTYKGDTETFQDVDSKRLDAMVTDRLVGAYINKKRNARLKLSGDLLYEEKMGIPVHPKQTELLTQLNQALIQLRNSSQYTDLLSRYFGSEVAHAKKKAILPNEESKEDSTTSLSSSSLSGFGSGLNTNDSAISSSLPSNLPTELTPSLSQENKSSLNWSHSFWLLLKGLFATLQITTSGLFLGGACSILLSWLLITPPIWVRMPVLVYVDFIRSTPFMIQLFAIYFGLPALGINLHAFTAATLAIAMHVSAYLTENIKSAYLSTPTGQHQAAATLGLSKLETLRHVIFPQMLPLLAAPTLNTLVAMIKDSAIVSVISVHELTMQTQQLISATFRPLEFYAIAAVMYATLTYPLLMLGRLQERKYKKKGLYHAA